jgi:hypothetical protein
VTINDRRQGEIHQRAVFKSKNLSLELNATIDCGEELESECPALNFQKIPRETHLGDGVTAVFRLKEGQGVSFILRDHYEDNPEHISTATVNEVQHATQKYWSRWIQQSTYRGRWEDVVTRSLFILKLLTFEPTGAIVAAPTFSLPEDFGGTHEQSIPFQCTDRLQAAETGTTDFPGSETLLLPSISSSD